MTEEEMRELISTQKTQLEQNKLTIEALQNKSTTDQETIKNLEKQVTDLKVKNHDLFLKVVQEPITQTQTQNNNDNTQQNENVQSLADLTNKLLGGQ